MVFFNLFASLSVSFFTIPTDVNTGNPVNTGTEEDEILMNVEPGGSINITNFVKTAPFGNRSFISTGQQFNLRATVVVNKAFADTTATLNLPSGQGYSIVGSASKAIGNWTIQQYKYDD